MTPREFGVQDFIAANAALRPQADCLVQGSTRLSFAQYHGQCQRLAAGLLAAGLKPGDRLAIMAHNCLEYLLLLGAAARMGGIVVPINWRLSQDELRFVIADARPSLGFAGPQFHEPLAAAWAQVGLEDGLYSLEEPAQGYQPFAGLLKHEAPPAWPQVSPGQSYLMVHTAAMGGRLRGALLSQANVRAMNLSATERFPIAAGDCQVLTLPLFHSQGLMMTLACMQAGAKNVILERFAPDLALPAIEAEAGNIIGAFPPMLDLLAEAQQEAGADLSSLRYAAGIHPPPATDTFHALAPWVRFGTLFGQTEAMNLCLGWLDDNPDSAGRPTPTTRMVILDQAGRELPVGHAGEICVESPSVFLGYWGLEADTAHAGRGGWHHTGDLGRLDQDGYLYYQGRLPEKELIKPGGENVYPAEVEQVIAEHQAVAQVCVIGVPDDRWGEAIKAVCVLEDGASLDEAEVIDLVASRLARYKKPKYVAFAEQLPVDAQGRIDRAQVKEQYGGLY
jgi:acyl-CoA synthetase (AMP-forming)/AMP-acid ligase II